MKERLKEIIWNEVLWEKHKNEVIKIFEFNFDLDKPINIVSLEYLKNLVLIIEKNHLETGKIVLPIEFIPKTFDGFNTFKILEYLSSNFVLVYMIEGDYIQITLGPEYNWNEWGDFYAD